MVVYTVHHGDCLETLRTLPANSVQCCVTSPPYWGLRDYGVDGQIGLEQTPEAYVARLVEVFREVRRVLRDDGTVWLNLGDSYLSAKGTCKNPGGGEMSLQNNAKAAGQYSTWRPNKSDADAMGLKHKDLVGIPWRVAFALQADGWWLRSDIIWHKPNPMPESVTDRPTKAHEYVFLLTKSARYFYDAQAVSEPIQQSSIDRIQQATFEQQTGGPKDYRNGVNVNRSMRNALENFARNTTGTRNRRSVWSITPKPFKGAHFATMPPDLAELCILAGCPAGGTVLDPFAGSGTTLAVAVANGRNGIGIELNAEYIDLARQRIGNAVAEQAFGLFAEAAD